MFVEAPLDIGRMALGVELDQHVAVIGAAGIASAGQIVTRRRTARRGRHAHHLALRDQPVGHLVQPLLRRLDVVALGQQHVGTEIGLVELRKEVLRHASHSKERSGEEQHDRPHRRPPVADQHAHEAPETIHAARCGTRGTSLRFKDRDAHHRHLRKRQQPAQQQRHGDDHEQRPDDLGHRRRRQIEREERYHGYERGAQQPPARGCGSRNESLADAHSLSHQHAGIVRHDYGVVDEHAHGYDETGQRGAVEPLAHEKHRQQRAAYGEQQRAAH